MKVVNLKDEKKINKEIFELAEEYGDWDDFGRWTFRDDDRLLAFVDAIEAKIKERREANA